MASFEARRALRHGGLIAAFGDRPPVICRGIPRIGHQAKRGFCRCGCAFPGGRRGL